MEELRHAKEMIYHEELDKDTITKLGLLDYSYKDLYSLELYFVSVSDYWHEISVMSLPYLCLLSVFYVIFIYVGQSVMKNRKPFDLRIPMILWNLMLAFVSIIGTWRSARVLIATIIDYSFKMSVCHPHFYYNANAFAGYLFIISKPIELGDTVFIVLRKQHLIFLHWYHHITVMLYVVASFAEHSAPGFYFYVINYGVHAIMYSYYTLKACRVRMPKFIPMTVTTIQLSQMVFGSAILLYVYWLRYVSHEHCQISDKLLWSGLAMYLSYFVLFGHFFYQAYYCGNFWGRVRRISKSISPIGDQNDNDKKQGVTTNGYKKLN